MLESLRFVVAWFLLLFGIGGILSVIVEPSTNPLATGLNSILAIACAVTLLKWRRVARLVRGKRDRLVAEQKREALQILDDEDDRMKEVLLEIRRHLGEPPRRFEAATLNGDLLTPRPRWNDAKEPLNGYFEAQESLLKEGYVVWARIVQANALLYNPGPHNAPAEVVYSFDEDDVEPFASLDGIAHKLTTFWDTVPTDASEQELAGHILDIHSRAFGMRIPRSICWWAPCAVSTIYVDRRHLPNRILSLPFVPILLSPSEPRYAMIVPSRYWPEVFIRAWGR